MSFSYTTPPGVDHLLVLHWSSDGPNGGTAFAVYSPGLGSALQAPFVREEYFMPIPYPDFSFGYFFEEAFPFDPVTGEILWDSRVLRTSLLASQDTTTVHGYLSGEPDVPVLTTNSSRMPVALPPPHWFGAFNNTETTIGLGAAIGDPVWLFLNQMQDMTPHPNLPYEIYRGGQLVRSGDLSGVGNPWGGVSSVSIPIVPGTNALKVFYDKYFVDGAPGLATVSATFDSQAADKNPPAMVSFNLLSGAEPVDGVPPTASGQVNMTFTEVLPAVPSLSYSADDGAAWTPVAVTDLGSGDYSANLPILPNNSNISLRVEAQDAIGNSLDYQIVPAFTVVVRAPVLVLPANDFATDQFDITFDWEAVETAVDYRIQIDTGDTFDSSSLIEAIVTGSQYTVNFAAKRTYYWRALARDNQLNESPWSTVWRLTIADPVLQVTTHTGDDRDPAAIEAEDGNIWVVWESCRPQCHILYKTGDGATWSQDTELTLQSHDDYAPSTAQTTGGRIWMAWRSYRSGNYDIFYKTTNDSGATWSADTQLTTDTADDYSPSITQSADGRIWVVWHSYRVENADLWYKTSDDNGVTWSDDTQLTTHTRGDFTPDITQTNDGKMWVVWYSCRSHCRIWYKTSDDGGATWSEDAKLTLQGFNDLSPAIAQTNDGRIWVAWYSYRNTNPNSFFNYDVFYKTSDDNGVTWSPAARFTRFYGDDRQTDFAALSSGEMALVWDSNRAGNDDIWYGVIGRLEDINPPPLVESVTHVPYPNPGFNDIVTVTASVLDDGGVASVELVWAVDGVPTGDLQMLDDGAQGDGLAGDGTYGVKIGSFPAETQVSYQIRATDIGGNVVLAPVNPLSFVSIGPFVVTSNILLVYDDRSPSGTDTYYKNALSVPFDFWDNSLRGYVDLDTLNQYLGGVVIWAMPGPDEGFLIEQGAQDNLASYLDGGGKLFASGQDFGFYVGNSSFYSQYLHATFVFDDTNVLAVKGVTGDPITDGLSFKIAGGDGADNQAFPSEIDPIAPAVSIFTYDDTIPPLTATVNLGLQAESEQSEAESPKGRPPYVEEGDEARGARLTQGESVPEGIASSGTAALRVDTGVYKVVYFAFGFEAIDSSQVRAEVMKRVLDFLTLGPSAVTGQVDLEGRADDRGAKVSLAGTGFSTLTNPDGSFELLGVPVGVYEIEVTLPTFLTARKSGVVVTQGEVTTLPSVFLRGGDINLDGRVGFQDLIIISRNYNRSESDW